MDKNKLNMKDFMNIGIFTALNLVLGLVVAFTIGYIPILYMAISAGQAFLCGIPMMIYYTRIKKFGMILSLAVITGILHMLMGRGYYVLAVAVVLALIGELILKSGGYTSSKKAVLSHAIWSMTMAADYFTLFFASKAYLASVTENYGQAYANQMAVYVSYWWVLVVIFVLTFLCGLLGGYVGRRIFRKHFERSGVL